MKHCDFRWISGDNKCDLFCAPPPCLHCTSLSGRVRGMTSHKIPIKVMYEWAVKPCGCRSWQMPVPSTATPKVKVAFVFSGALFAPKLRRQAAKDSAEGKGTVMNYPRGHFYRQSRLTLDGVALTGYHPQSKNDSIGVKVNRLVRCRFRQVFVLQFRQSSLSLPIKGRKRGWLSWITIL